MIHDTARCRHGVTLCYRCRVGENVTDERIAKMVRLDNASERISIHPPSAEPLKEHPQSASPRTERKKRRIVPCIHRGEYIGVLDCACDGARDTYRCTIIDRPGHPDEKAFCIGVLTSKAYSFVVDPITTKRLHRVRNGEIFVCKALHSIDMNGIKQEVGCSMYTPNDRCDD